jgi:hypothetical protein
MKYKCLYYEGMELFDRIMVRGHYSECAAATMCHMIGKRLKENIYIILFVECLVEIDKLIWENDIFSSKI